MVGASIAQRMHTGGMGGGAGAMVVEDVKECVGGEEGTDFWLAFDGM